MTEIEAIEKLKQHFEYLKHAWKPNPDCKTMDAIGYAIQVLEKQIPKKPKTDDRYIIYICPCCNDFIKVNHNYCTNCGQRLDWESDEE